MRYYLDWKEALADTGSNIQQLDVLFLTDDGVMAKNYHGDYCKIEDYGYSEMYSCVRMYVTMRGVPHFVEVKAVVDVRTVKEVTNQAERLLRLCGYRWNPYYEAHLAGWYKKGILLIRDINNCLCPTVQTD